MPQGTASAKPAPKAKAKKAAPKKAPMKRRWRPKARAKQTGTAVVKKPNFTANRVSPVAVPGVQGTFLTVPGRVNFEVKVNASQRQYLVAQWTPTAARLFLINEDTTVITGEPGYIAQLANGNPQFIRPLAFTLRMRNTSVFTSMGGTVRLLNTPNQIGWILANNGGQVQVANPTLDQLSRAMASNFDVKTYAAAEFRDSKETHSLPAAQVEYKKYDTFTFSGNADQVIAALYNGSAKAAMNVIIVEFPSHDTENEYEVTLVTQDACRFASDTLYSQLEREGPYIPQDVFDLNVRAAARNASAFLPS